MEPLIAPVLDSCVLPHGFQIQSEYLACTLSCLHAVILKVTTGATSAFSTNMGVHCISVYPWLNLSILPSYVVSLLLRERYGTIQRSVPSLPTKHVLLRIPLTKVYFMYYFTFWTWSISRINRV